MVEIVTPTEYERHTSIRKAIILNGNCDRFLLKSIMELTLTISLGMIDDVKYTSNKTKVVATRLKSNIFIKLAIE